MRRALSAVQPRWGRPPGEEPMNANGAISEPVLTPVTTENSGRLPDSDQPFSRPAPNAPSPPPVDSASQGPAVAGRPLTKPFPESPQHRSFGPPVITSASY